MKITFGSLGGKPADFAEYSRRVAHVKSIVVMHPGFIEALEELKEIHQLSNESFGSGIAPDQLCLLGPTGAGKTTVVESYVAKCPRIQLKERTVIPVLHVRVPQRARSPKELASKILRVMGDPLFDSGTEGNMTQRIKNFVEKCSIEMIILDEFQHLIDRDTDHVLATASDWLKNFIEEINIPVVLCGLPDSERVFEHNEQLDGRYPNRVYISPFGFNSRDEQKEFRKFLMGIDRDLPFCNLSNLADPSIAGKIYYFSFGVPRYVMDLIKQAAKFSFRRGHDQITERDFKDAFNRITRSIRPYAVNTFEKENFDLIEEIEKERKQQETLFQQEKDQKRNRKRK